MSTRRRFWTPAEDAILEARFADMPTAALAAEIGRTMPSVHQRARQLGLRKSAVYLASPAACRLRRGEQVGQATRFRPGQVPANKGLRRPGYGPGRMKATQFRPGQRNGQAARQHMPVGSTRLVDGYLYRKVADTPNGRLWSNWRPEHHLVWIAAHGPVPAAHVVVFRDGDPSHVRLDNLMLISRDENMRRNTVHRLPRELKGAIQLLGALHRKIRRRHRGEEQNR